MEGTCPRQWPWFIWKPRISYTVQCRYNAVIFLPNPHNRHAIARPWGRHIEKNLVNGKREFRITSHLSSVVIVISDSLSATAIAVSCIIPWWIRPSYNGTWLYIAPQMTNAIWFTSLRRAIRKGSNRYLIDADLRVLQSRTYLWFLHYRSNLKIWNRRTWIYHKLQYQDSGRFSGPCVLKTQSNIKQLLQRDNTKQLYL